MCRSSARCTNLCKVCTWRCATVSRSAAGMSAGTSQGEVNSDSLILGKVDQSPHVMRGHAVTARGQPLLDQHSIGLRCLTAVASDEQQPLAPAAALGLHAFEGEKT